MSKSTRAALETSMNRKFQYFDWFFPLWSGMFLVVASDKLFISMQIVNHCICTHSSICKFRFLIHILKLKDEIWQPYSMWRRMRRGLEIENPWVKNCGETCIGEICMKRCFDRFLRRELLSTTCIICTKCIPCGFRFDNSFDNVLSQDSKLKYSMRNKQISRLFFEIKRQFEANCQCNFGFWQHELIQKNPMPYFFEINFQKKTQGKSNLHKFRQNNSMPLQTLILIVTLRVDKQKTE